jgi:hypothetical protein
MSRGSQPTTHRSPCTGGRDVHLRLSAAEYAACVAKAEAAGYTGRGAVVRWLTAMATG